MCSPTWPRTTWQALLVSDTTGSTPAQLAMQKGHMMCSDWLAHERARHTREAEAKSQGGLRFGMPRGFKHLAPLLWGIILGGSPRLTGTPSSPKTRGHDAGPGNVLPNVAHNPAKSKLSNRQLLW